MKGAFRFPMIAGGASPDPAVFCPTEGFYNPEAPDSPVIWNPINPAEWTLLAEFQNNSPNSATFDPVISTSGGEYAWDLGDGTYLVGDKAVSHTYLTTATRTVKLYGKGTCEITAIDFSNDNIIGELDLSNAAFIPLTNIILHTNSGLTDVIFNSSVSGTIENLLLYSTGITGVLDLSMFTSFGTITNVNIQLYSNPSMTGIAFANSITGNIYTLYIYSTGITGTLDLSMFTSFNTTSAGISLHSNASLTGITWATSITGTFNLLHIYSTGIVGTLDLSKFSNFSTTATIQFHLNPSVTDITWASSITGTFASIYIYSTGITGILDLSKFTAFTATATVYLNNNSAMTGVTFPGSTITGFIRTLRLYSNTALGYVDLTKLKTGVNSCNWDIKNNGWTADIVNHVLYDIDGISASGFTSRVVNIGGTNADPDTTSGGYNGSAARTSLIAKTFTVTIT